jgi:hypothetical protein
MADAAEIQRLIEHCEANPEPPGVRWHSTLRDGTEEILTTPTVEVLRFAAGAVRAGHEVTIDATTRRDGRPAIVDVPGYAKLVRVLGLMGDA